MSRRDLKYKNSRKMIALKDFDRVSLDDPNSKLTERCKFNFSYFDSSQQAGQAFSDLTKDQLVNLLEKLKEFSKDSRLQLEGCQKFKNYKDFPLKTEFKHPSHIPHQAYWGAFRLGGKFRLVGFTVSPDYHGKEHPVTKQKYDKNTFYIVFIDLNHLFWIGKER